MLNGAIWNDYDHDYDLDLLLVGEQSMLFRNQGKAGFEDRSRDFPFVTARATDAIKFRLEQDSKAFDVAVFYSDHAPVLYKDELGGKYGGSHNAPAPYSMIP